MVPPGPVAAAGGPYSTPGGQPLALSGAASECDSPPCTWAWTVACPGRLSAAKAGIEALISTGPTLPGGAAYDINTLGIQAPLVCDVSLVGTNDQGMAGPLSRTTLTVKRAAARPPWMVCMHPCMPTSSRAIACTPLRALRPSTPAAAIGRHATRRRRLELTAVLHSHCPVLQVTPGAPVCDGASAAFFVQAQPSTVPAVTATAACNAKTVRWDSVTRAGHGTGTACTWDPAAAACSVPAGRRGVIRRTLSQPGKSPRPVSHISCLDLSQMIRQGEPTNVVQQVVVKDFTDPQGNLVVANITGVSTVASVFWAHAQALARAL